MSRIYFHGRNDEAEVWGPERAYMGVLCSDIMIAAIGDLWFARDWLTPLLPSNLAMKLNRGEKHDIDSVKSHLRHGGHFIIEGQKEEAWIVALNTALAMGSDPLKLLARLHGQCEVHCWVDGPNRKWLADIIRRGRKTQVLRKDMGWETVAAFLEKADDDPVVCSYSVCNSFPDYDCLPESHQLKDWDKERQLEKHHEEFLDLPPDKAWELCIRGLREADNGLELTPEDWNEFHFYRGWSAFNLPRLSVLERQNAEAELAT